MDVLRVFPFLPGTFPALKIQARNEVDWLSAEILNRGTSCLYFQDRNDTQVCREDDTGLHAPAPLHMPALGFQFSLRFPSSATQTSDKRLQLWALLLGRVPDS